MRFGWRGLALEPQEPVLRFSHWEFHKLHTASFSPQVPQALWIHPSDASLQTLELIASNPGLTAMPLRVVGSTQTWQPCTSLDKWWCFPWNPKRDPLDLVLLSLFYQILPFAFLFREDVCLPVTPRCGSASLQPPRDHVQCQDSKGASMGGISALRGKKSLPTTKEMQLSLKEGFMELSGPE